MGYKTPDHAYWSECWRRARANMPRVTPRQMGSPMVLRMLLGYKTERSPDKGDHKGLRQGYAEHCRTAECRGDRPRDPQRRKLLELLAGPYGTVFVRIIAKQRGLDLSKWPIWPDRRETWK